MRKLTTILAAATLGLAGLAGLAYGESYESQDGINWFGDSDQEATTAFNQYSGDYNEGQSFETGSYEDEPYEASGVFSDDAYDEDDYGYYDSDYDYSTDDDGFEDFYGDSDEIFDTF
ncbi:MAG: hypothetical protein ACFCVE_05165 [Phycisphaerae bacterium]